MKKVLLIIDTWMAFRDFVRGPLGRAMRTCDDMEFHLCVAEPLLELAEPDDFHGLPVHPFNVRGGHSAVARTLYDWAKWLFIAKHPDNTFSQRSSWTRQSRAKQQPGRREQLARLILHSTGLGPNSLIRVAQHFGSAPDFQAILRTVKPDAVVFSTVLPGKIEFLKEVRREGIPLVLTIPTWDKPNSKGPLSVTPDWALVWSEEMGHDMALYHDMPRTRVLPTGVLYFDDYFHMPSLPSKDEFYSAHGIPEGRKIIQYAMAPPSIIPCGITMAHMLHKLAANGAFGQPCHILARVSPKDDPELYRELHGLPFLTVQTPPGNTKSGGNRWLPGADEAAHRIATVQYSDVIATFQSSMILDACCLDRPVVNLGFDADMSPPPWQSVARYFDFTHAKPVLQSNSTAIVRSRDDLVDAIKTYLQHPETHREGRRNLLQHMIGRTDGLAHQQWLQALRSLLGS